VLGHIFCVILSIYFGLIIIGGLPDTGSWGSVVRAVIGVVNIILLQHA